MRFKDSNCSVVYCWRLETRYLSIHAIYNIRERSNESSPTNQEESETFFSHFSLVDRRTQHCWLALCYAVLSLFCFYLGNELWMDMMMDGNTVRCRQLSIEAHYINI